MNLFEGALYFGALAFFFYWGFKSGELRGMEYNLAELWEELNNEKVQD